MMQGRIWTSRARTLSDIHKVIDMLAVAEIAMTRLALWTTGTGRNRPSRIGVLLLAFVALTFIPAGARANCTITGGAAPEAVNFSPPATITVAYTAAVGTVLYQSGAVNPSTTNTMTCSGTSPFGVTDVVGTTPASGTIYPTGISGVGFSIGHGSATTLLTPYPNNNIAAGSYTNSTASYLTLLKTGPIVSGSVLPAGTLAYWQYPSVPYIEAFNLANSVTILDPACSVNTSAISVTLPTISSKALSAVGSTAGATPFNIALTCSSGATLDIELDASGTASGITGVLTKTAGTSAGVGVQVIDQSLNPVVFGTPTVVGTTPSGTLNIPFYGRYYRTGTVTAGTLTASATFTLSYQ